MQANYEQAWQRPFNLSIARSAVQCWCDDAIGIKATGAIFIDSFKGMESTCSDEKCKVVKAHTLENHLAWVCTTGRSLGGKCPAGHEVTMAKLVAECSCDYHALNKPFPWKVLDSKIRDDELHRMCTLKSCDQFLLRLNEIWPDGARPGVRKCGVNSPWEVVGQAVAGLIVLIGLIASAKICRTAHREEALRARDARGPQA